MIFLQKLATLETPGEEDSLVGMLPPEAFESVCTLALHAVHSCWPSRVDVWFNYFQPFFVTGFHTMHFTYDCVNPPIFFHA